MKIRIGSRGSRLALLQSHQIIDRLKQSYPEHEYEIVIIKTHGDQNQMARLDQMNTSGIFVKEIEHQLLSGVIDMAVHSMKDLPSRLQKGLMLADVMIREDSRDALVLNHGMTWETLKPGAVIATGSKRRKYQLLALRPDVTVVNIRGNIDTRLQKMKEEGLDGMVVAAAALHRLHLEHEIAYYFKEEEMVPAATQGAIGVELCQGNQDLWNMIHALSSDMDTRETQIERSFLYEMNGGCHAPIGARCHIAEHTITLTCVNGEEDGSCLNKRTFEVSLHQEASLAKLAADAMKEG